MYLLCTQLSGQHCRFIVSRLLIQSLWYSYLHSTILYSAPTAIRSRTEGVNNMGASQPAKAVFIIIIIIPFFRGSLNLILVPDQKYSEAGVEDFYGR
ncbi:hypothetical protein B9Z19DRAFT_211940 [Tuber borchii]|uniref:Uncharacterized protein n=1 Tax=Tuber borchii TaxID=42251 RepID=A0A2T7A5V4_TUBBO|nr:hypothetical protein B9Z19DRAFT_211940 [Tuber borchii]